MNTQVLIAGFLALSTTIGHFVIGSRWYLKPMLGAEFKDVSRKVMHSVFHYVSVFLITSSAALLFYGFGMDFIAGSEMLIKFIAVNYAAFAVWQIILALTSGIDKGIIKMFQWTFFILIAIFAWMGVA